MTTVQKQGEPISRFQLISLDEITFSDAEKLRIRNIIEKEMSRGDFKNDRRSYLAELSNGPYDYSREQNL